MTSEISKSYCQLYSRLQLKFINIVNGQAIIVFNGVFPARQDCPLTEGLGVSREYGSLMYLRIQLID